MTIMPAISTERARPIGRPDLPILSMPSLDYTDAMARETARHSLRRIARETTMSPNGLRDFLQGATPRQTTRAKLERWLADQGRTSRPPNVGQLVRLLNELSGDLAPQQTSQLGRDIARLLAEAYEARRLSPPRWVQDLVRQYRSSRSKSAGEVA